jgi:zinc protease
VTLLEDHALPVVSVSLWVAAGSKNEAESSAGYAHFLEHLIQRGSKSAAPHEYTRRAHRWGGSVGVHANYDRTSITFTGMPAVLDEMLAASADMAFQAALKDSEIDLERGTLFHEIRTYYDLPASVAFLDAIRSAFPGHPYHVPMLGSFQTLGGLKSEAARAFYQNLYVPNNMALAVAGDFDPAAVSARIESVFGSVPKSAALAGRPAPPATFSGHADAEKRLDFGESWTLLTFVAPGYRHPDRAAFDLLAASLADPGSPITASLAKDKSGTLSQVSYHLLEDAGLLYIAVNPDAPEISYAAATAALRPIVDLKRNGLGQSAIADLSARLLREERLRAESMTERAERLGEATLFGGARYYWDRPLLLSRVTPEDVTRVARTWLVIENMRLVVLVPKATPPIDEAGKKAFHDVLETLGAAGEGVKPALDTSAYASAEASRVTPTAWGHPKSGARPGEVSRTVLPNGMTVVLLEDRSQPLAAASLHVKVGSGDDPAGREGLGAMALRLLAVRTAARAQDGRPSASRRQPLVPEAIVTRDFLEIRFVVPAAEIVADLAALGWSLQEPLPGPQSALEAARQSCLASLLRSERDPGAIAHDLFHEKVYAGDPYAVRLDGTPAGLAAITGEDLAAFAGRAVRPDRVVLSVVGDVDPKSLTREVERIFGGWTARGAAATESSAARPPSATASALPGEYSRQAVASQSRVLAGVPASPLLDGDFLALRQLGAAVALLSFEDLVFTRRAAFSVVTIPEGLRRGGSLAFEVIVSHEQRDDALFELQRTMRRLATDELGETDRRDVARMIAANAAIADQGVLPLASNLAYREAAGLGARSWRDEFAAAPPAAGRLKELAERYFKPASWISVVVGPPPR